VSLRDGVIAKPGGLKQSHSKGFLENQYRHTEKHKDEDPEQPPLYQPPQRLPLFILKTHFCSPCTTNEGCLDRPHILRFLSAPYRALFIRLIMKISSNDQILRISILLKSHLKGSEMCDVRYIEVFPELWLFSFYVLSSKREFCPLFEHILSIIIS
jgi:hypothetical protein